MQQYYIMRAPLSQKNCSSLWLALPPQIMTLKLYPALCSFKSHKYDNYDKAPYIISSYHQSHKATLKAVLHLLPQTELTLPTFPQHTNKEILKCTYSMSLKQAKLGKTKILQKKKKKRLCIKSPTSEAQCAEDVFLMQSISYLCCYLYK